MVKASVVMIAPACALGMPGAAQAGTAYLQAVDPVLETLIEKQTAGRATLGQADTQPEQIGATQGLANEYDVAGDALEAIKPQRRTQRATRASSTSSTRRRSSTGR